MPKGKPITKDGGRPWTHEDTTWLLNVTLPGATSMRQLCAKLGRTEDAVQTKLWKLVTDYEREGYKGGVMRFDRRGMGWSPVEDDLLRVAYDNLNNRPVELMVTYMVEVFNRPRSEIEARLRLLRGGLQLTEKVKFKGLFA